MWLGPNQFDTGMVDGKPLAGTVSMLASRFTNMKSPSKAEKNPKVSGAIDKLIEASREYNDAKLVDLVHETKSSLSIFMF